MAEPPIPDIAGNQPAGDSRSPSTIEPIIVYGAAVALLVGPGVLWGDVVRAATAITDADLAWVLITEAVLTAALLPWLLRRGWSPRAFAGAPGARDALRGIGVGLLAYVCYAATWLIFAMLQPELAGGLAAEQPFAVAVASPMLVIAACVLNPVFEEFLWLGYGVSRLSSRLGLRWSAVLSVGLRTAVHSYQGPWALLGPLPLGVAFTWYYGRTGRIWPVVFAHVLFDAIPLALQIA